MHKTFLFLSLMDEDEGRSMRYACLVADMQYVRLAGDEGVGHRSRKAEG